MRAAKKSNPVSINPGADKETVERLLVLDALRKNKWNIAKAAKSIKMSQAQFSRILRRFGFRDVL
ncbi:MAG: helix-turn-helix domain-containing protein [bacterium]|nr:helix-turn-helix domain-containing protein [candidate division WOR-3 bacterium]MDH5684499.1 helix-turn-helix domain-containing protein [candidate division WOR-3 bacterium]